MTILEALYFLEYLPREDPSYDIIGKRDYFGPVDIDKLHIRLLTKQGELITFNDTNFSMALEFTMQYS